MSTSVMDPPTDLEPSDRPDNMVSRHRLSTGHFRVDDNHLKSAQQHGIIIRKIPSLVPPHEYEVFCDHDDLDILCPSFIPRDGNVFNEDRLVQFLDFIRQPVHGGIKEAVREDSTTSLSHLFRWKDRYKAKSFKQAERLAIFEERKAAHQLLRFLTTDSIDLPETDDHDHLQEAHNECHEGAENELRAKQAWSSRAEFGETDFKQEKKEQKRAEREQRKKEYAARMGRSYKEPEEHSEDEDEPQVAIIPNVAYDAQKGGYVFNVSDHFKNIDEKAGPSQIEVKEFILTALCAIKGWDAEQAEAQLEHELVLNADELHAFLQMVHDFARTEANIEHIRRAHIEERTFRALESITERRADLENSRSYLELNKLITATPKDRAAQLLLSTTALTSILNSEQMHKLWGRYHVAKLSKTPLPEFIESCDVLQNTLAQLFQRPHLDPAEIEALMHEFFPLLSSLQYMTEAIDYSVGRAEDGKPLPPELHETIKNLRTNIDLMKRVFDNVSATPFGLSKKETPEDSWVIMRDLQKFIGQPGGFTSAAKRSISEGAEGTAHAGLEYAEDFFNSVRGAPITIGTITAAVIAANTLTATPQQSRNTVAVDVYDTSVTTVQSTTDNLQAPALDDIYDYSGDLTFDEPDWDITYVEPTNQEIIFNLDPVHQKNVDKSLLPAIAEQPFVNFHWDIGPLGPYKHYVGAELYAFSSMAMDKPRFIIHSAYENWDIPVNYDSHFDAAASATIQPVAEAWLATNVLQNASHAGYWTYTGQYGFTSGLSGILIVGTLLAPVADLGYGMGAVGWRAPRRLYNSATGQPERAKRLGRLAQDLDRNTPLSQVSIPEKLDAAELMSKRIREAQFKLKIGLDKSKITFDQDAATNLQLALYQLDVLINNVRDKVGIDSDEDLEEKFGANKDWYQEYLAGHCDALLEALGHYMNTGDTHCFQKSLQEHVNQLIGFEVRHTGRSRIAQAIMPDVAYNKKRTWATRSAANAYRRATRLLMPEINPEARGNLITRKAAQAYMGIRGGEIDTRGAPTRKMTKKQEARLKRLNAKDRGKIKRKLVREARMDRLRDVQDDPDKQMTIASVVKEGLCVDWNRTRDHVARGTKFAQNFASKWPSKRLTAFAAGLVTATSVAIDMIDVEPISIDKQGNVYTLPEGQTAFSNPDNPEEKTLLETVKPYSDQISSAAGTASAATVTTGAFMGYNFLEDWIGVHVLMGIAFIAGGAFTGLVVYRKGARPTVLIAAESIKSITDLDVIERWAKKSKVDIAFASAASMTAAVAAEANQIPLTREFLTQAPDMAALAFGSVATAGAMAGYAANQLFMRPLAKITGTDKAWQAATDRAGQAFADLHEGYLNNVSKPLASQAQGAIAAAFPKQEAPLPMHQ